MRSHGIGGTQPWLGARNTSTEAHRSAAGGPGAVIWAWRCPTCEESLGTRKPMSGPSSQQTSRMHMGQSGYRVGASYATLQILRTPQAGDLGEKVE